jgi:hypothetical protein
VGQELFSLIFQELFTIIIHNFLTEFRQNPDMSLLPSERSAQLAIRKLSETRRLLRLLITSSESFDYPKAKLALAELESMIRELARTEARITSAKPAPDDCIQFAPDHDLSSSNRP